ncbi:hypothetical protein [Bacillus thuringiensis]|uniref:hypothetical protein n=1 Tax=Bacillus cereus group TaxID=86661 RepID=UPI0018CCAA6D|nr:hypothetical protein [Bacillus thuringiensis]MEB9334444.1 hypothetical protein [Bacillus cereus]HEF1855841.1 hypothetical protein [Bacillus cereus]HEF1867633.1 hypothetical protein [Bacillus cereus]HEF1878815.1 hypothetical protein [Bacillus cereus]HEF1884800.1 hypothetical protein [Bacillus cereus]
MIEKRDLWGCEIKKDVVANFTEKLEILFQKTEQGNLNAQDQLSIFLQQIDSFENMNKKVDDC